MAAPGGVGRRGSRRARTAGWPLALAALLAFQTLAASAFAATPAPPSEGIRRGAPQEAVEPSGTVAPAAPEWVSPAPGKAKLVSPVAVKVRAGSDTATLTLTVNGTQIRSVACTSGATVDLGAARLGKGANRLTVTATSASGASSITTRTLSRVEWPYATCIVIDKSDYRLYWVRDQQLVASYKIAHGRHNWTPVRTWKILAKYKTNPRSIYGPRKMRLFKRVGKRGHYRYVFTRYAIHGTNQPKLIGTQASHGCIRMYNKDVLQLWPQVPLGTFVVTRA